MTNFEVYGSDILNNRLKGRVCPIMSGIGPMCSGSSWVGIICIKDDCRAWYEGDCKLIDGASDD